MKKQYFVPELNVCEYTEADVVRMSLQEGIVQDSWDAQQEGFFY